MKILLVIFKNVEAYGLRILHSILSSDYECKMLFINEYNTDLIIQVIKEFNPQIIGFSLVTVNFTYYKSIYSLLRQIGNFKIILGGWHPTLQPNECLSYCDIVCRGEGESIIKEIISDIENDSYQQEYIGHRVEKLNFPLPLLDKVSWSFVIEDNKIKNFDPLFNNSRYGIMIGRGCSRECTYCSNSYMKKLYPQWNKIRYRNYDTVLKELKWVTGKIPSIKTINFYDEIFKPPKEGRFDFFSRYKKEIGLPFYCLFYPGSCSEELAKELKESGLVGVWLGVQSGSQQIREKIFNRRGSNKKILEQAEIFARNNIDVRYDFIFDNPFETEKEMEETRKLIKQLPKPHSFNIFRLKFFPNTKLTQMAISSGLIGEKDIQSRFDDIVWGDIVSSEEIDKYIGGI